MAEGTTKGVKDSQLMKERRHAIAGCESYQAYLVFMSQRAYSTVLPPKPKKMPGRTRKKRIRSKDEGGISTRVSKIGTMRDGSEQGGNGRTQQGSVGGASGFKKGGAGGSGCKRKVMSSDGTQKRQGKKRAGTSGFSRWFGLQDEPVQTQDDPMQTQDDPVQTQADPVQTQDQDQVEQTQEQAEIDLTQVEQIQEQTQDQVQTQEQPKQVTLRRPSARILQRKLAKQASSQNTTFNVG
ncbi:hypothetical protein Tco_0335655 [Tanacetum coccineum]